MEDANYEIAENNQMIYWVRVRGKVVARFMREMLEGIRVMVK